MSKELLFKVTADDCRWEYFKGSGKGGQKRNKTSSAARCTHVPSGAVGSSQDGRSQILNKQSAFRKMFESKEFQVWLKIEIAKRQGVMREIEDEVRFSMEEENLKIETKNEDGEWTETKEMEDEDLK